MTRPTNRFPDASPVSPGQCDPDWRVDDEGVLHTGRSAPFAERVVVAYTDRGDRS